MYVLDPFYMYEHITASASPVVHLHRSNKQYQNHMHTPLVSSSFSLSTMAILEESTSNWVVEIQNKAKEVNTSRESDHWIHRSIYKVPSCMKDLNKDAYKPTVVSFGPYHHGEDHLVAMEEHKQRALLHFLKRADKPLSFFLKPLKETLSMLMGSYESLDDVWRENDCHRFLKLMMVDGCFMIEILRFGMANAADYAVNDPIFSYHGILYTVPYIKRDMMMVENQIPLLVLQKLLSVEFENSEGEDRDVNRLVLRFFSPNEWHSRMDLGLHPLDLYRKGLLHGPASKKKKVKSSQRTQGDSNEIIRSATNLYEAGVKLKVSQTSSLKDITFKHGVLRLPAIVVDDTTESMLLNLMAFERLHNGAGNEITSYVFFMDNLIDSARDVSFLNWKKIIHNALGSDKAVAKLFNSLSKDATLDPDNEFDDVHRRVNKYCSKSFNTWRANLLHTYFRSPWAFMSLAAASFLLGLTVAQTVYAILQYYDDSSSPSPSSSN